MKHTEARPYAVPEAAARKLLELSASVQPINDRIHIEKINGPFLSKAGCNTSGPEFGAGIRYAIEQRWLELHESGTYVRLLPQGRQPTPASVSIPVARFPTNMGCAHYRGIAPFRQAHNPDKSRNTLLACHRGRRSVNVDAARRQNPRLDLMGTCDDGGEAPRADGPHDAR
jgi:hypothetical protein